MITIIQNVITMSLCGTMVTFLLMATKPVARRFFSPEWNYYIWTLVLAAFACPLHLLSIAISDGAGFTAEACEMIESVKTQIAFGIKGLFLGFFGQEGIYSNIEKIIPNTTILIREQMFDIIPVNNGKVPDAGIAAVIAAKLSGVVGHDISPDILIKVTSGILILLWIAGAITTIAIKLTKYRMFRKTLLSNSERDILIEKICPKLETRRTSLLEAPLIIGLFRPALYLPFSVEAEKLNLVLRHELTHYRRHDLLYKWLAVGILSFHWFNPVTRIVIRQIDEECEISCDYEVIKDLCEHEKKDYMRLILDMLSQTDRRIRILTTQMSSSGKILKRRFEMIQKPTETNGKRRTFSVVFACVLIIVTLFAGTVLAGSIDNNEDTGYATDEIQNANLADDEHGNANNENALIPAEQKVAFTWYWPVDSTEITNSFGERENPAGIKTVHNAVDIKAEEGAEIASSIKGTVSETGYSAQYGNYVRVAAEVSGTQISTFYAHLSEIICDTGDEVTPGTVIGKAGATGMATGPHLHFEIMINGEYVDPAELFNL